ncbi:AraC family transcriptional regulator [Uliginosibacterium sp. H3]|uniref:AraC family transcriptional regulator n=1 Tax=Uliginosibacterium silvisoli TaxID=3114758 RepID=A0ABU6K4Q7_9RHOO|nr:AraC family transcriptional regulator [Uliginosibacterium sp. H3]
MEKLASHVLALLARFAGDRDLAFPQDLPPFPRVPSSDADRCLRTLAEQFPSPSFSLEIAPYWHPSDFGVLGYAWLASPCLHTALERLVRFKRVVGERPTVGLRDADEGIWVVYDHRREDADLDRWGSELLIALLVTMCRANFGKRFAPLQLRLRYPEPDSPMAYADFFRCPVAFNAPENAFLLSAESAHEPLDTGNLELAHTLDTLLTTQLAAIDKDDLISRCKAELYRLLPTGDLGARELAERVHLSERSLHRKLAERGTTVQKLLDQVRKDIAVHFLAEPKFSVTEIAFLCGFANSSSFARAFLRWTGSSPTAWRENRPASVSASTGD